MAKWLNEESWILVGQVVDDVWYGRKIGHAVGEPAQVSLGWRRALRREERYGDVVGFLHTHPSGFARPSDRDVRTMDAWCSCFGKPLLCAILAGEQLIGAVFEMNRPGYVVTERIVQLTIPVPAVIAVKPEPARSDDDAR